MEKNRNMKILLVGFMGAGKSTLLKNIQDNSIAGELSAWDLDDEVLSRKFSSHTSIQGVVSESGWEVFRCAELEILKELSDTPGPSIISSGGGTLFHHNKWILESGLRLIYLEVPFETCWQRIKDLPGRPLVTKGEQKVRELFNSRKGQYEACDVRLDASSLLESLTFEDLVKIF